MHACVWVDVDVGMCANVQRVGGCVHGCVVCGWAGVDVDSTERGEVSGSI